MNNNLIIQFVVELVKRLAADTPWFFRVLSIIGVVVAVVSGLPGLLTYVCDNMQVCITLPEAWEAIYSKVLSISGIVMTFIAQLTATTTEKEKEALRDA